MIKKKLLKRIILGLIAFIMVFTSAAPVFATENEEDLSRFEKTEYENKYGKDGRLETINTPGYSESYKLTNEFPLESNVVVYLITQNLFYIDDSLFLYDFKGTMNAKNEFCDIAFTFDFELLENKNINSKEELKCGETVNIRNYQFAVYSGFYNFYNYGMNGFWSQNNGETVIMRTLTPNFDLSQNDKYLNGKEAWVEVKPNETVKIYVMLGTKDWYEKVQEDVFDLAMELEKITPEIEEETIPETEEETTTKIEEETTPESEEETTSETEEEITSKTEEETTPEIKKQNSSNHIKYGLITLAVIAVLVAGFFVYKKMK